MSISSNANQLAQMAGMSTQDLGDVVENLAQVGGGGVPSTRTITAGTGLTGGGDLSANRTLALAASPTFTAPVLGTPASGTLTNATGLPLTTGVTGILPIANGGTNAATAAAALTSLGAEKGWVTVPASAAAAGTAGDRAYASGFYYICVATNTWQRAAIATW